MLARYNREVNFRMHPVVDVIVTLEMTNPPLDENCNERPVVFDYPIPLTSWPDSLELNNESSIGQTSNSFETQGCARNTLIALIPSCIILYIAASIIFFMDPTLHDFNLRIAFIFVTVLATLSYFGLWWSMRSMVIQRQSYIV